MKLALIGYGKMGQTIEEIALAKNNEIVLQISSSNQNTLTVENIKKADVAIEFTNPNSAFSNVKKCLDAGVAVVCGTTGWLNQIKEITDYCKQKNGAFLYASNFSIGVNIFFELNQYLSRLMSGYNEYDVSMKEIHHTQKKDAPSGTAITLAENILENIVGKKQWVNEPTNNQEDLQITSKRIDGYAGTHEVKYSSDIDDIEIKHTAHSRKGFAAGALLAAEFLLGKKGIYSMKDVINAALK